MEMLWTECCFLKWLFRWSGPCWKNVKTLKDFSKITVTIIIVHSLETLRELALDLRLTFCALAWAVFWCGFLVQWPCNLFNMCVWKLYVCSQLKECCYCFLTNGSVIRVNAKNDREVNSLSMPGNAAFRILTGKKWQWTKFGKWSVALWKHHKLPLCDRWMLW